MGIPKFFFPKWRSLNSGSYTVRRSPKKNGSEINKTCTMKVKAGIEVLRQVNTQPMGTHESEPSSPPPSPSLADTSPDA